jgi:hypothetical protein
MIIPYDKAKKAIDSKTFIQHISKIIDDVEHPLHRYSDELSINPHCNHLCCKMVVIMEIHFSKIRFVYYKFSF